MSKRSRDDDTMMSEPLGPRSATRKAMEVMAEEKAKQDVSAEKRQVNKKLRAEVDDLADMFGKMKSSDGKGRKSRKNKKRKGERV